MLRKANETKRQIIEQLNKRILGEEDELEKRVGQLVVPRGDGWLRGRREWDKSKWADTGEYIRSQKAPESRFPDDIIGNEYFESTGEAGDTVKLSDVFVTENPELQVLHFSEMDHPELKLVGLPENLGNLKYVHSLSFPDNPNLTKLPMSILDMKYLTTLNIVNTPIDMPQEFWDELGNKGVVVIT